MLEGMHMRMGAGRLRNVSVMEVVATERLSNKPTSSACCYDEHILGRLAGLCRFARGRHVLHRMLFSTPSCTPYADRPQKELSHTIHLHPSYFGPRMLQFLESKLYSDVEGTCSGEFGYIIAVVSILDIGKGLVMPGSGQAEFVTRYRAIVFKPFKGEVVDGVVNNVNKVREKPPRFLVTSRAA